MIKVFYLFLVFFLFLWFFPTPTFAVASDIVINEIMYDLEGTDDKHEWIELYNRGQESVDLTGWRIKDGDDTITGHGLNVPSKNGGQGTMIIAAGAFAILSSDATTFLADHPGFAGTVIDTNSSQSDLANDGDTLKLSADKGVTWFSEVIYTKDQGANGDGRTLERDSQGWHVSSAMGGTPGQANSAVYVPPPPKESSSPSSPPSSETPSPSTGSPSSTAPTPSTSTNESEPINEPIEEPLTLISIKEAKTKNKQEGVLVEGVVTVAPNLLGKRIFYIQDETAGIQVYFSKEEPPSFNPGKKVRIKGKISESFNEKRVVVDSKNDLSIVGEEEIPSPQVIQPSQINEDKEGSLLKIKGKVLEPSGSTFFLEDGSGRLKVFVKETANIQKPRLKSGDSLEVTGILSQYKQDYRLLPRSSLDIIKIGEAASSKVDSKEPKAKEVSAEPEIQEGQILGATFKETGPKRSFYPYIAAFLMVILGGLIWWRKKYLLAILWKKLDDWHKNLPES